MGSSQTAGVQQPLSALSVTSSWTKTTGLREAVGSSQMSSIPQWGDPKGLTYSDLSREQQSPEALGHTVVSLVFVVCFVYK